MKIPSSRHYPIERDYSCGATVDATTAVIMADREAILDHLQPLGLDLAPEVRGQKVPVCVDMFHFPKSRGQMLGLNHKQWSQIGGIGSGALAGATTGALSGILLGPLGLCLGAAVGAFQGAVVGGSLAAGAAEVLSHSLGEGREIIVSVPNVVGPNPQHRYQFMLGMHTSNRIAQVGDRGLGYGFQKTLSDVSTGAVSDLKVEHDHQTLLRGQVHPRPQEINDRSKIRQAQEWLRQPLLGHRGGDRFSVSALDRFYDAKETQTVPVSGYLKIAPGLVQGMPAGDYALQDDKGTPTVAFQTRGLPEMLTYPEHLRRAQL